MDSNIDFGQIVKDTLKQDFSYLLANLDPENERLFLDSIAILASLSLQLPSATTDEARQRIQQNILHVKATITNIEGIMKVKTFRVFLRVFEDVLMAVVKAAIVAAVV